MIHYDPNTRIVTANLVDLEHCGFDHESFEFELHLSGIDDAAAQWPVALVVNFAGGAIVTPDTSPATRAQMDAARGEFERVLARLSRRADATNWGTR